MKINTFSKTFIDLENDIIKSQKKNGELEDLTLAQVCVFTILQEFEDEKPTGQDKSYRYSLAMKIKGHNNLTVDLSVEDVAFCKERIAKGYGSLIYGQAEKYLEGEN